VSVQCSAWHSTDIKSLESMSVFVSLLTFPFVHNSDHSFCPIFLKCGTRSHVW